MGRLARVRSAIDVLAEMDDALELCRALLWAGEVAVLVGDLGWAREAVDEAVPLARRLGVLPSSAVGRGIDRLHKALIER